MLEKRIKGFINQQGGLEAENIIKRTLKSIGYDVIKPPPNTPAFDLIASKGNTRLLIQVKTDMNNDGKYPKPTREQKQNLITIAKEYKLIPIFINYNFAKNEYHATDIDGNIIDINV